MSYVVIDHHHDEQAGVYRLVVGLPVTDDVPVYEDGEVVLEERVDGAVVPRTEPVVVGHADVRDFVFATDDERWRDLSADEIAAAQRAIVADAITPSEPKPEPAPVTTTLPGVGESL